MSDSSDFGPVLRGGRGASPRGTAARGSRGGARPAPVERGGGVATAARPPRHDRDFGPPRRGGRSWAARLARTGVAICLVLVLAVVGTGIAVAVHASDSIRRVRVDGLSGGAAMNVLVVGSDSREGLSARQRRRLTTGSADGARTDTIFVLSVRNGQAAMLSLPRDLYVTRCDGSQGRINAASGLGGPSCLTRTVAELTGIPLTHYVEVDFLGFVQLVDAVGGVPVYLDEPLRDADAGIDLPAGCTVLDGRQALGFVRVRKVDSDLGRIERQQRFLRQLAGEVSQPRTWLNVPRLYRVAGAAGQALTADASLGTLDLLRLARAGRRLAGEGLRAFTVPADLASVGGASVLLPRAPEADALFARFRDGSVLDPPERPARVQPGDVQVTVLNGSGVDGAAAQAQQLLAGKGFDVTGIGDADPVARTEVRHRAGQRAAARLVARQVGGAQVQRDDSADRVQLVLGPDADLSGGRADQQAGGEPAGQEDTGADGAGEASRCGAAAPG